MVFTWCLGHRGREPLPACRPPSPMWGGTRRPLWRMTTRVLPSPPRRGAGVRSGATDNNRCGFGITLGGEAMGTPLLEARDVAMRYRSGAADVLALQHVSLHVDEGEFVALVGPSGSGKTTLLSIFAGLETPTAGTVALRGDPQAQLLGRAGYMPQRDLLLPWRNALGNAIVGLAAQGMPRAEA